MQKTVIIIDDDQDDLDIMKHAIQNLDPSIFCLSFIYPEEALKAIMDEDFVLAPDFVFIDFNMPGLSGDKCLKVIRSSTENDGIVITLYSTSMPGPVAEALKAAGANHIFEKPVRMRDYAEILSAILLPPDGR